MNLKKTDAPSTITTITVSNFSEYIIEWLVKQLTVMKKNLISDFGEQNYVVAMRQETYDEIIKTLSNKDNKIIIDKNKGTLDIRENTSWLKYIAGLKIVIDKDMERYSDYAIVIMIEEVEEEK